jgi:hypothetical protein
MQPNELTRCSTKQTFGQQIQFQMGLNSMANALLSLGLTRATEYTTERGQNLNTKFSSKGFDVALTVDKHSPITSVADHVEFLVLVELKKDRSAMALDITSSVTYKGKYFGQKTQVEQ